MFRESMGSRLANEALIFGKKLGAQEMRKAGFVSHVFPDATFQSDAIKFLKEQLEVNDFTSMLEAKRLILAPLLDSRLVANTRWHTAVARDFASGRPEARVQAQVAKLAGWCCGATLFVGFRFADVDRFAFHSVRSTSQEKASQIVIPILLLLILFLHSHLVPFQFSQTCEVSRTLSWFCARGPESGQFQYIKFQHPELFKTASQITQPRGQF